MEFKQPLLFRQVYFCLCVCLFASIFSFACLFLSLCLSCLFYEVIQEELLDEVQTAFAVSPGLFLSLCLSMCVCKFMSVLSLCLSLFYEMIRKQPNIS
jgi:hypothetical protein